MNPISLLNCSLDVSVVQHIVKLSLNCTKRFPLCAKIKHLFHVFQQCYIDRKSVISTIARSRQQYPGKCTMLVQSYSVLKWSLHASYLQQIFLFKHFDWNRCYDTCNKKSAMPSCRFINSLNLRYDISAFNVYNFQGNVLNHWIQYHC